MLERCLIEVTLRVGVRIEEEALGAAFHQGDRQRGYIVVNRMTGFAGLTYLEFEGLLENAAGLFQDGVDL